MSDQVYQGGNVENVEGHFTAFSTHTKGLCSSVIQSNTWDLFLAARPLFDKVPGFYLFLEELIFYSDSDITAGVDVEHLTFTDDFDSNTQVVKWANFFLNQGGAGARISFSGGLNGRMILGNLSVVDSAGAGVAAGIVRVLVVGVLVPEFDFA